MSSHRRAFGTNRNVPSTPRATPPIRYSSVVLGTKCDRSADAPAATLKKISSVTCVITCTACCNATAAVARIVPRPAFCRNRVLSARPPTPAGVVVAAKVFANCMMTRLRKLTTPEAHAHNAAAAPTYVERRHRQPQQGPPPVRGAQLVEERGHRADERVGDVDQGDQQHQLDDLLAGEPGDGLGLDLVGPGLLLDLVARGRHHRLRIVERLAQPRGHRRLREPARGVEHGVLAQHVDWRPARRLRRRTGWSSSPATGRCRTATARRTRRTRSCRSRRTAPCPHRR